MGHPDLLLRTHHERNRHQRKRLLLRRQKMAEQSNERTKKEDKVKRVSGTACGQMSTGGA